jgi:hypothetical protein
MKATHFLLLLPLAALPLVARADVSLALEIQLGRVPPPPPPEVIVIEQVGPPGPPPWAPASGLRRNRTYYYYPGADVYFRPADRVWFYLDGRDWRFGVSLPATIHVDFERSVSLAMETDRPYQFHGQVRTYYPADYFVTKVKVKEKGNERNEPPASASRGNGNAAKGKSNGRGRGK